MSSHDARLGIVILAVEDLARSAAFYDAAFGWRRAAEVPVYIEYECGGGMRFGIYERGSFARNTSLPAAASPSPSSTTATELYVRVADVDAMAEHMIAIGARPLDPLAPREWGDRTAYFADPDGNVVAIADEGD